ncbi:hypothetical protein [Mucilaginibacter sp. SJ]|uniref:hypothetical protein n=1 Tax=Mucilaginibacter sp. SJ TaxID=3029053 RepID=UPI0023A961F5|nr:hypothetical protein [Mucilaginibacter sp. SJ]WEA02720.1 hypothetical protein MusilaSJ_07220 [Mucilaginibacter sp. SJ]
MKKLFLFALLPIILLACKHRAKSSSIDNSWHELDLKSFKLSLPPNWHYQRDQGIDSFVGHIIGPNDSLSFDFSSMGYANHLIQSEQEYLKANDWQRGCDFCEEEHTYSDSPNIDVKIKIHTPTVKQKSKYPKADYIADMLTKDSTLYIPIVIPAEIKAHNFNEESKDGFRIKTIWPKIPSKGITGVYYQSKSSTLSFQLSGSNLSKQDQDLALQMFRTIVIKTK